MGRKGGVKCQRACQMGGVRGSLGQCDLLVTWIYYNILLALKVMSVFVCFFNPYAALGTFLVFCSLISLTILAVLMQMV